jgi:hypothetical protein
VAQQTLAAFLVQKVRVNGHETRHLHLNGRAKQLTRPNLNPFCKEIR